MGITVVLETEDADALETVEDPSNILHRILPPEGDTGFPHLSGIDWYGDTVFNHLQAPLFLAEWTRLKDRIASPQEQELCDKIKQLAERVAEERHLYLKFYGD